MGDTIAVIGIFSEEANKVIEEKAWIKNNPLTSTGKSVADIKNELLLGLYSLTE